jgi:uncharacterized membrane protein YdbT with pleckstrin-like domain
MNEFELESGEQMTKIVRRHPIVLFGMISPFIVLALLPLFIPFAISLLQSLSPVAGTLVSQDFAQNANWFVVFLSAWWLFLWISVYSIFTQYYLTEWIITTTRIVDIRQYGFFSRQVSSFLLAKVQDVTTDVEGFLPTIFHFGTLNVETAGREEKFQMRGISNPTELRDLIMREIAVLNPTPVPATQPLTVSKASAGV